MRADAKMMVWYNERHVSHSAFEASRRARLRTRVIPLNTGAIAQAAKIVGAIGSCAR